MKKIYTLLSLGLCSVSLLTAAQAKAAGPSNIFGEYNFTSNVVYGDNIPDDVKAKFPASSEFTITERSEWNSNPKVNDFIIPGAYANVNYSASAGTIVAGYYQYINGSISINGQSHLIGLSNEDGTTLPSNYELSWTIDENGVITMPTFTLVAYDALTDQVTQIIATYTNGKASTESGGDTKPKLVPGNYTVYANKYAKDATDAESVTFGMSIDELGYLTAFVDNDNIENSSYGNEPGTMGETSYSITQQYFKTFMNYNTGAAIVLGGSYDKVYESPNLKLSYDENTDTWTLSSFTTWNQAAPWNAKPTDLVAEYQIVKVLKEGQSDPDALFAGTHDFENWWKADYSANPDFTVESGVNFAININSTAQLTSIAGYDIPVGLIESNNVKGVSDANTWTLTLSKINSTLAMYSDGEFSGQPSLILAGPFDGRTAVNGADNFPYDSNMIVTYDPVESVFSLTDFTVWKVTYTTDASTGQTINAYNLAYRYSSEEIEDPNGGDEEVSLVGTHTIYGTKYDYTSSSNPAGEDSSFKLTITEDGEMAAFAGYDDLSTIVSYGMNAGTFGENSWSISNVSSYLQLMGVDGATQFVLFSDGNTSRFNSTADVTVTKDGNKLTVSDFTVWSKASGNASPVLMYAWKELSNDVDTGVNNIESSLSAVSGYYNLQGMKIENPTKGVYIRVQDGKAKKILVK